MNISFFTPTVCCADTAPVIHCAYEQKYEEAAVMIWFWDLSWLWKMLGSLVTGFRGVHRRGRADRQGGKNPPRQKGFPARWDLGLCDLYSGDLLSCTDAGAALSCRSGPLFRSGARFGLSIPPLHTSSTVLLHASRRESSGRPLASKPRWITR